MNYRHAFHAGNFADVLKHAILALVIDHLKQKPASFCVLDTHAGGGAYDLTEAAAPRTGEWQNGIGRLLGPGAQALCEAEAAGLAPYLEVVRALNPSGALRRYPGSPVIARTLLRSQDRLIASEIHAGEHAALARQFAGDKQTNVIAQDGWQALKALLPPSQRRGAVLIDPPYEDRHELENLRLGLSTALRRFRTGVYLAWYPIKDMGPIERLHDVLSSLQLPSALRVDLLVRAPLDSRLLNGCGLIVINPPWTLISQLERLLPYLAVRLGQDRSSSFRLQQIGT